MIAGVLVSVTLILRWRLETLAHRRRVDGLQWRIHVNGIRGKSTVARIIAGMLREHGLVTVAKSTGTFAAVINRDGVDEPIKRKGPPTILEQIEALDADAVVIGSHGQGLFQGLLGSTGTKIVRRCSRPVLLIRSSTS